MTPNPLESRPKSVTLLGKGPSELRYRSLKNRPLTDELWCINEMGIRYMPQKIWAIDNLKKRFMPASFFRHAEKNNIPVITSKAYEDMPYSCEFPLQEILGYLGQDELTKKLFVTTVCYALLWAEYIGVEALYLWGLDMGETPPELSLGTAYMLGRLAHKGVEIHLSEKSRLNNLEIQSDYCQYYGYYQEVTQCQ